jgi:ferritin-like metal-binding protein YciE
MPITNQSIASLHNLLDQDTRKFTSAEIQLLNTLPHWIETASSVEMKTVLLKYLDLVRQQVQTMEIFIEKENIGTLDLTNGVMYALIQETDQMLSHCTDPAIKDACLLANIQAINHYKINRYGTAASFAQALGMEEPATAFHEATASEKEVDSALSKLAAADINIKARSAVALPG